jgi:hypothetical protein
MPTIYRWTKEYTDKINRIQFHSTLHHPLTCGTRSEPGHEVNGRDKAILVAKQEGYLERPFCRQKQHWLPEGYISESKLKPTPSGIECHKLPAAFMRYKEEKQEEPSKEAVFSAIEKWKQVQIDNANLFSVPIYEYLAEHNHFALRFRTEPHMGGKSALLRRLLDGKEPLPYPPPKNGVYPWYSLIEDNEVHRVSLGFEGSTMLVVDSYVKASQLGQLFVNGNGWDIVSANYDAKAFLDLLKTQWVEVDGKNIRPDDYAEKALAIAFGNPEFVVKDRFYGEFRVWYSLTGHTMSGYRYTSYKPNMELFLLAGDLRGINPVVTSIISECNPDCVADGFSEIEIAQTDEVQNNSEIMDMLSSYREKFIASRPELDHDVCEFACGGWLMEKIK